MKVITRKLIAGLALAGIAVIAAAVVLKKDPNTAAPSAEVISEIEFAPTDLASVQVQDLARTLPLTGAFSPVNWAYVKSKVAGDMRAVYVREGESVKKNQVIARVDVVELEARVQEKVGNLESSRAQLDLAYKIRTNNEQLFQRGFISQNAFDNSESGYLQAKGVVKANEAQLALAKKALDDSIIRAPIDGVVSERLVQAGEKVAVDGKLFTVMDLSRMELAASIPSGEIGNVQIGQSVVFRVEGFTDRTFTGKVDRINPTTQSGSRSIPVYVIIDNRDFALKGGMFAKGAITVGKLASVKTVPMDAVHQEGESTVVYTVENGVLKRRAVKVGLRSDEMGITEIIQGVEPRAVVVHGRFNNLREGSKVRVTGAQTPQAAVQNTRS